MNAVKPFVSSKDVYAGTRWQLEIASQLEQTNFGLVCVTRSNQGAKWLNFEAGALAKAIDSSRVVPIAIDLEPAEIELPMGQFQGQPATINGITEVMTSLNSCCPNPLTDSLLERSIDKWWPDLEAELTRITAVDEEETRSTVPTDRQLIEETLITVRSLARDGLARPSMKPIPIDKDHPLLADLEELVREFLPEYRRRVLLSPTRRAIGIRGGRYLPVDIKELIMERAAIFGVRVDFLSGPRDSPRAPSLIGDAAEISPGEDVDA